MVEELYFSSDGKSLRRGRRASKRRPIERSVEVWRADAGDEEHAVGVAVDISLEGVLIHVAKPFAVGDEVMIDIKRGKAIDTPSFLYARGKVVRMIVEEDTQVGVGVRMTAKERRPDE